MPINLDFFVPAVAFANLVSSFAFAMLITVSTIPSFKIYLIIESLSSHVEPNWAGFSVKVYFVWVSKVGFYMEQLTNIHKWALIWNGFTTRFFYFFLILSWIF